MNLEDVPAWVKWTLGLLLAVAAVVGWCYIAGYVLLALIHIPFKYASIHIWFDYFLQYPKLRNGPLTLSGLVAAGVLLVPVIIFTRKPKRSLHGDARFATPSQIIKAGLHADTGIIVGKRAGRFLVFGGQQHVMMSAPTRSGKGVGVVIPNLLNWPDSVVVLDIKQENWNITAGFRAEHGQRCYLFNPAATDHRTHRFNPLDYISDDEHFRINDTQKIANMLYPDLPNVDPIWNASCRSLFVGVVLYLLETPELPCTLGQVLRSVLTRDETSRHFQDIIEKRELADEPLSVHCQTALNDFIGVKSENTRSSIKKTFTARLELWLNPIIDAATSASDFDLRELRTRRMSVYIGITPDNLDRLQPIINLLFQIALDTNTRQLPEHNPLLKYSCLMLMDEFTSIGKIGVLAKGISYVAGYNLRMLPIIQSPAQIREVYGKDAADTFMVNHALQIVFAPREFAVAKEISDSLGFETVKSASESKGKNILAKKNPSLSVSDQRRALLLPQEVRDIGPNNALLLTEGIPPIRCKKIRYFNEKTFTARLLKAPAVPLIRPASALELVNTATTPPPASGKLDDDALEAQMASLMSAPYAKAILAAVKPPVVDASAGGGEQADPFNTSTPAPAPAEQANPFGSVRTETRPASVDDALASLDDPNAPPMSFDFSHIEVPERIADAAQLEALHSAFVGVVDPQPAALSIPPAATEPLPGDGDEFAGFSLDFSHIEIPVKIANEAELAALHAAFIGVLEAAS